MTREATIAAYYDRLTRWTRFTAACRRSANGRPVHRALADPTANGRATSTRLHDILTERLSTLAVSPSVLDAGCGLGGTIVHLARQLGGRYVGITLSPVQASYATALIARAGLEHTARVLVRSFDDPPPGPFTVILAIESLAHSKDPAATLTALAKVAAPRGLLVVVDDMPKTEAGHPSPLLTRFQSGWQCPALWSVERYRDGLLALGADVLIDHDLTPECRPRTLKAIGRLERLNRAFRRAIPLPGWRSLMDSHDAGLALERLYRARMMSYRLLIARLP